MDIDRILTIVFVLISWRVAMTFLLTVAIALTLNYGATWVSGVQCVAIGLTGLWFGLVWDETASRKRGCAPPFEISATSPSTAAIASMLAGAAWGGISAKSLASIAAGAALLALFAAAWALVVADRGRPSRQTIYASLTSAALAYPISALLMLEP